MSPKRGYRKQVHRDDVIGVRYTPDERQVVERAAVIAGETLSQFMRRTTLVVANALVLGEDVVHGRLSV